MEPKTPSAFATPTTAWEVNMNADAASHALEKEVLRIRSDSKGLVERLIAELVESGRPIIVDCDINVITERRKTLADVSSSCYPNCDVEGGGKRKARLSWRRVLN
ncbi:hypothetical protein B9Z19DRAFT_1126937 [Tuber borchii]|uniref:Uncharacterized protein n=1 Tax=Tuber borchii TaxID=42251 RepID=A0A2T6ZS82_TUBBO|nr:hypothetical protein B9Z19DRAFT_1126937 [Tuber borchii]